MEKISWLKFSPLRTAWCQPLCFSSLGRTPFLNFHFQIQGECLTSSAFRYKGVLGTIITLAKTEGPVKLYSGLPAGLQRQISFASLRIGLYDTVQEFFTTGKEGKQAVFLGGGEVRETCPRLSSGSGTSYTQCSGLHNKLARQHQYLNTRGMEGRHAGEWEKVTPERQKCVRSQESLQAMLSSGFILKIMGCHWKIINKGIT